MDRAAWLGLAGVCGWAALALWQWHPAREAWPLLWWAGLGAGVALASLAWWRPAWGAAALLALLPVADDGIWSGWRLCSTQDLQVLAVLAGVSMRLAVTQRQASEGTLPGLATWWWAAWALGASVAWWVAPTPAWGDVPTALWGDVGSWAAPWVGLKSLVFASVLWFGVSRCAGRAQASTAMAWGMVAGLAACVLCLLLERGQQVGLFNLDEPYRTTAWFWEMSRGGGALDAYLAMAMPFLWWALARSGRNRIWWPLSVLLFLAIYALVTTYSRGVILAVGCASLVFGWCWRRRAVAAPGRRRFQLLSALAAVQAVALIVGATAASERFSRAGDDAVGRWKHWQSIARLPASVAEWATGIGLAQLPVRYIQGVPEAEWPGRAQWAEAGAQPAHVHLLGPQRRADLVGKFALAQRMSTTAQPVGLTLSYRATKPVKLRLSRCEQHLLYAQRCQTQVLSLLPSVPFKVQRWDWAPLFDDDDPVARRRPGRAPLLFKVSVAQAAADIDIAALQLQDAHGQDLLRNGRFDEGLTHWYPLARAHYLPWHADNLYLEIAVERGIWSLLAWLGLAVLVLRQMGRLGDADVWAVSVLGFLVVGVVVSLMEFSRTAFLAQLVMLVSSSLAGRQRGHSS